MSTFPGGEAKENDNTVIPVPTVTVAPVPFYATYPNYPPTSFELPCGSTTTSAPQNYNVKPEDSGKQKTVKIKIHLITEYHVNNIFLGCPKIGTI